jgi:hypothetical protein
MWVGTIGRKKASSTFAELISFTHDDKDGDEIGDGVGRKRTCRRDADITKPEEDILS